MENIKRLREIAGQVKELQSQYSNLIKRSALVAKEMGGLLFEAKAMIKGGQWSKWLATELDLTPDAAYRYMTIHRRWPDVESHKAFPDLTIIQMFDVARGKPPRSRSYKLCGQSLDTLLDILDERLCAAVRDFPELESVIDAIDSARPTMERAGLLKSGVEKRKQVVRENRRKAS